MQRVSQRWQPQISLCYNRASPLRSEYGSLFAVTRILMASSKATRKMNIVMPDPEFLVDGPASAPTTVVLAHGAGAGMDTPFMDAFALGLAERNCRVVRFEFPYMAERRRTGKRRPPDREDALRTTWLGVLDKTRAVRPFIGGKSMGGRIASLVADEAHVAGLVCLGYPFHPSGQPEKHRTEHLKHIATPTLILQGERDPMGNRDEVSGHKLSSNVSLHWLRDGDHSFKPRASSGRTQEENWREAIRAMVTFIESVACRGA